MAAENKSLWQRFQDEFGKQLVTNVVRSLFAGLALAGITLYAVFKALAKLQVQLSWAVLTTICLCALVIGCVGFVALSIYLRGQRDLTFASRLGRWKIAGKRIVMVYLPVALGIAFCVWAYIIGSKVFRMSDDVRHLRVQAVRYVLPREVSGQLATDLHDAIKNYKPKTVVFAVAKDDKEAAGFMNDVRSSFSQAGWPGASEITYSDDLRQGLYLGVSGPGSQELRAAMQSAFDKNGMVVGSGGPNVPPPGEDVLFLAIEIGHRRRDKLAVFPTRRPARRQPPWPGYPRDEDYDLPDQK